MVNIEELYEGVYRIGVPLEGNPLKELNSYFIRGEESDVLIDAGFNRESCRLPLEEALEQLGSVKERRDMIVTHMHSDHMSMCEIFVGPGRTVYMNRGEYEYMKFSTSQEYFDRREEIFLEAGFTKEMLRELDSTNPAKIYSLKVLNEPLYTPVEDGYVVKAGKHELQFVCVPGHTPFNCMIYDRTYKTMFSGDHVLFDITPNITFWLDMEDSLGDYIASLKKARDFEVVATYPGHRATGDYYARIESLLSHHERRLNNALHIVRELNGGTACEIAGEMSWKIRARNWAEFPLVQKWFAVGECMSHLNYLMARGMVSRKMEDGMWRYY